jgi:hypothetical protein
MESYEILKTALSQRGIKAIANEIGLSESLLYKWSQEPSEGLDSDKSGVKNPLDRVIELYTLTNDPQIIHWMCERAGGFFVKNPHPVLHDNVDAAVFRDTQEMIRAFSELLNQVSDAIDNGDGVDDKEAKHIRREWEDLKRIAETFAVTCEKGRYHKKGADAKKK